MSHTLTVQTEIRNKEIAKKTCEEMGIETGIDLEQVFQAGQFICAELGRAPNSRVAQAMAAKRQSAA